MLMGHGSLCPKKSLYSISVSCALGAYFGSFVFFNCDASQTFLRALVGLTEI